LLEDSARRAFDLTFAATDAGIEAALPGARACDVWQAMARVLGIAEAGQTDVGRMGHGIGLNMTEPPSIHPDDQTLLEAGMVLAIEPTGGNRTDPYRSSDSIIGVRAVVDQFGAWR